MFSHVAWVSSRCLIFLQQFKGITVRQKETLKCAYTDSGYGYRIHTGYDVVYHILHYMILKVKHFEKRTNKVLKYSIKDKIHNSNVNISVASPPNTLSTIAPICLSLLIFVNFICLFTVSSCKCVLCTVFK